MATANKVPVILAIQGQPHKTLMVGTSATVRSALQAAGLDADAVAGSVTLNGESAELGDRLKKDAYLSVTPKVAGGR